MQAAVAQDEGSAARDDRTIRVVDVHGVQHQRGIQSANGSVIEHRVVAMGGTPNDKMREVGCERRALEADAAPALAVAAEDLHGQQRGALHLQRALHADVATRRQVEGDARIHGQGDAGRHDEIIAQGIRRVCQTQCGVRREGATDDRLSDGHEIGSDRPGA